MNELSPLNEDERAELIAYLEDRTARWARERELALDRSFPTVVHELCSKVHTIHRELTGD